MDESAQQGSIPSRAARESARREALGRDDAPSLSVRDATAALRHSWRLLVGCGLAAGLIASIVLVLRPRTYTSTASFAAQARRTQNSAIAGFAAQLGVGLATTDPAQSPAFFADLAASREILGPVLDSLVSSRVADAERYLRSSESDPAKRKYQGIQLLRRDIRAIMQPKTGVVTLSVLSGTPRLSHRVASLVLTELNRFNLTNRQSQAAAERRFVERRLDEVRDSLRRAENDLSDFHRTNRGFVGSAELKLREARLNREVELRQQVYVTLAQTLEQARIDEVRDTPVLSIIESPNVPVMPDSRQLGFWMLFTALATTAVLAWVVILRQLVVRPSGEWAGQRRGL